MYLLMREIERDSAVKICVMWPVLIEVSQRKLSGDERWIKPQ